MVSPTLLSFSLPSVSLDVGEVQPPLWFPLENAADVLQGIWSVGIGVVLVPIALRFLKEADDLRFSPVRSVAR